MDRLIREANPPTGQLASPKPQYKKPGVDEYEPVEGQHGAPFATLKDASGNIVSPATEDKLEQVRQLLAGVATEAKLEQARVLLNTISNKDFATQATLEVVQSELALIKSELDNIKQNQTSGDQKVQLSGTNLALHQTIVTGAKTIASTAAEIFAGSNRLAGRHAMVITNVGAGHVYIGASGVTTNNGFPLFSGDTIRIDFNPASNVPVFAVSDGVNINVRVVELA